VVAARNLHHGTCGDVSGVPFLVANLVHDTAVVRKRRLWLRSLAGLEPVDVLHRRLEGYRVDPMEVNASGVMGVPGLLDAVRAGGVRLANNHGTGVIEDPVLAEHWDDAGDWISDRHRRGGSLAPLPRLSADARSTTEFETAPCLVGGEIVHRLVVVRLQLVATDRRIEVMQGASARVLAPGDDPELSTAATAKDVWVVGGTVAPPSVSRRRPLPQVDLIASVPTRAAESLFWAGRALERAELLTRALEVVLERTTSVIDPETAEPWVAPSSAMLLEIAGLRPRDQPLDFVPNANDAVERTLTALARQLGSVLAEVSSVREFFSTSAGRALARLASARSTLQGLQAGGGSIRAAQIDRGLLDSISNDLSAAVEAALQRLGAGDREVIALRVILDLEPRAAAHLLGISDSACTTRLSRALARLQQEVRDDARV